MQVIARQHNDITGPDHETLSLPALDLDTKIALDNVVINNQVGRWPENRRAMLGREARRNAPWREELGVQKYARSNAPPSRRRTMHPYLLS
jgi:hypothetical protein